MTLYMRSHTNTAYHLMRTLMKLGVAEDFENFEDYIILIKQVRRYADTWRSRDDA